MEMGYVFNVWFISSLYLILGLTIRDLYIDKQIPDLTSLSTDTQRVSP